NGRASIEPFKNACLFALRDALAVIGDLRYHCTIAAECPNSDRRTRWRILQRIVEKLLDRDLHQSLIQGDWGKLAISLEFQETIRDYGFHRVQDFADKVVEVRDFPLHIDMVAIELRHV